MLVLIDRLFAKHKSVTFTRSLFTFSNNSFILLLYYLKRFFQQKNEVIWLHTIRLFQFSCHTRYQQTLNNFEHFLFHKSHQRDSIKKMFLKISQNSQQTHVSQSLFSNEVTGLSRATLLKKRLRDRYFPVSFPKKLRTHFL